MLEKNALVDKDKLNSLKSIQQAHNGIINKRSEPYAALLKVAKASKTGQFERFVVLPGAKSTDIEECLGNAMARDHVLLSKHNNGITEIASLTERKKTRASVQLKKVKTLDGLPIAALKISRVQELTP